MTCHGFALNFDAEVDLFDCWQSFMSQVDDLEGPSGLELVENSQTLDTTSPDEVRSFVDKVREVEAGEGEKLWALVNRLPQINGICGNTNMKTKICKYLNAKKLLPTQYERKFRYYILVP